MKLFLIILFFVASLVESAPKKSSVCRDQETLAVLKEYSLQPSFAFDLLKLIIHRRVIFEKSKIIRDVYSCGQTLDNLDLDEISKSLTQQFSNSEEVNDEFVNILRPVAQYQKEMTNNGIARILSGPVVGLAKEDLSAIQSEIDQSKVKFTFYPILSDAGFAPKENLILVNPYRYLNSPPAFLVFAVAHELTHAKWNKLSKFVARDGMSVTEFIDANWPLFRKEEASAMARESYLVARAIRSGALALEDVGKADDVGRMWMMKEYLDKGIDQKTEGERVQFYENYLQGKGDLTLASVILTQIYMANCKKKFTEIFQIIEGIAQRGKKGLSAFDGMTSEQYFSNY